MSATATIEAAPPITPAKSHKARRAEAFRSQQYARNCTRPFTILFRVVDDLKAKGGELTAENIVALAQQFHAEQVACIEAKDIPDPFLDTCMARALAKMSKGATPSA